MGILSSEDSQVFCSKSYVLEERRSGNELDKIPDFLHIQPTPEDPSLSLGFTVSVSMLQRVFPSVLYLLKGDSWKKPSEFRLGEPVTYE